METAKETIGPVQEAHNKGLFIAELLNLKPTRGDFVGPRYNTAWGSKTPTGLHNCMVRIVESNIGDLQI